MRQLFWSMIFAISSFGSFALAASDIEVKVESLTNTANSTVIEVCGKAVSTSGLAPLLVTVKHDASNYTTMTGPEGKWCVLIRRWAWNGKVDVSAADFKNPGAFDFHAIQVQLQTLTEEAR